MSRGAIRAERRARSERRKRRKKAIYWSLGGIVLGAFVISLLVPGGLSSRNSIGQSADTRINTGGPVELQPDMGDEHLTPGTPAGEDAFATSPATSGPHWQTLPNEQVPTGSPARWGFYPQELPDEVLIHNLEHGGIGLHYNCPDGCPDLRQQLTGIVPQDVSQFIVSPYTNMDSKIAVTAWRHILYLDEVDEAQIQTFIDAYKDRAPESVPNNQF